MEDKDMKVDKRFTDINKVMDFIKKNRNKVIILDESDPHFYRHGKDKYNLEVMRFLKKMNPRRDEDITISLSGKPISGMSVCGASCINKANNLEEDDGL